VAYRPLPDFVLRAPLLPATAIEEAARRLLADPLGETAVALASPSLAARLKGPGAARALDRYGRRAAFRTTPHGLLSGVMMGRLGAITRVATGRRPAARLTLSWGRAAALARALLDDPEIRSGVRLRQTPSLLRAADNVRWLVPGEDAAQERVAELDFTLERLLAASRGWAPWTTLATVLDQPDTDVDEFLLLLIDDGLLLDDLTPPLVGPPAIDWMCRRLGEIAAAATTAETLHRVRAALDAGDHDAALVALQTCPGHQAGEAPLAAVLVHQPQRPPVLARAPVERAAALAPLLFRLQEALAAPVSERLGQPSVGEALTTIVENFGAGALDIGGLASGDYGVPFGNPDDDDDTGLATAPTASDVPRAVLTLLLDTISNTLAAGRAQAELSSGALATALGDDGPTPPATAELFVVPARAIRGAPAGSGWLLGLHAPAGASWGRFAHALAPALPAALTRLADAEQEQFPDDERLDVAFAPSPGLADLCAHPPLRRRVLGLTSWPADETKTLTPADLELGADPSSPAPLSLRARQSWTSVVPSPLWRVRSTTAPAGLFRLLTGWSLYRQHAPWALALGPLADLARLPRIAIDGFVISPASWRLPPDLAGAARGAIGRWRRQSGAPRWVQVGRQDELLPVDLARSDAADDLRGADRVWEIWPPLGSPVDSDGRRVEAVIALCDHADAKADDDKQHSAQAARGARAMGEVPPPRLRPAASHWTTFKLFGADDHQDRVLAAVAPAVQAALSTGEIDAWFFLRYVERPGPRPHLRLRVHAGSAAASASAAAARFAERLQLAVDPLYPQGALVSLETAPYYPERARLGGAAAVTAAHQIFQSDSALVVETLDAGESAGGDDIHHLVCSFDALAAGCGLDLDTRWHLARDRRRAGAPDHASDLDDDFRARARDLRAALATPAVNFIAHRDRVAAAVAPLDPAVRRQLLPTLLHLAAVRLAGPHRDPESRATIFWERTLEGLSSSLRRDATPRDRT
jgi:thiopeptide-type bacteriocin biosynthesis protein